MATKLFAKMKLPWQSKTDRCSAREVVNVGCTAKLFSYDRLQKSPMRLTVQRLDGTSFGEKKSNPDYFFGS